jgi:hypothetical protein
LIANSRIQNLRSHHINVAVRTEIVAQDGPEESQPIW